MNIPVLQSARRRRKHQCCLCHDRYWQSRIKNRPDIGAEDTARETVSRCVIHDITERKRAEERIKNQLYELIRRHDVFPDRANRIGELEREVNKLDRCMGDTVEYPSQISSLRFFCD